MTTKELNLTLNISDNNRCSAYIEDAISQAEQELVTLNETVDSVKKLKPQCDKLDYILSASSGALCGIVDVFLVGKPGESPLGKLTDKWFADRTMDFAKLCHPNKKDFDSLDSAIRFLEEAFKVPYDQSFSGDAAREILNLTPRNHHFKSLAHNPTLLGLFFSLLNQFANTSSFVSEGQLITIDNTDGGWELEGRNIPSKLFCGFANWIGHLISDVSGSQSSAKSGSRGMGIPSPLWTWINDVIAIKAKLGITPSETNKSMNELAVTIFEKGFDLRFQTAQAIPVLLNELLVRLLYSIRRLFAYFSTTLKEERSLKLMWEKCEPFSNATVKRMLTVAHGTFCLVDTGDAAIRAFVSGGGTFNAVEFVLRLNVAGIGRFAISLYGEVKRGVSYYRAREEADFASKEITIINNYMEGLKILSREYNDAALLTFTVDFLNSGAYEAAFLKSVKLAEMRKVPPDKILRNKNDIDNYFGGNRNG